MSTHTDAPGIDWEALARAGFESARHPVERPWEELLEAIRLDFHKEARAVVSAYLAQRRAAGYVELPERAARWIVDYLERQPVLPTDIINAKDAILAALVAAPEQGGE